MSNSSLYILTCSDFKLFVFTDPNSNDEEKKPLSQFMIDCIKDELESIKAQL